MLEIAAAVLTLLSVVLLKYKNIHGWWIGIIAAILYGIVFFQSGLNFQSALQIIFVIQCFDGLYSWKKSNVVKIIKMESDKLIQIILAFSTICIIGFLIELTSDNLVTIGIVYIDLYVFGLALFANWMLIKGYQQSWYIWIMVDVILIGVFIYLGLWWSLMLYIILLTNAVNASIKWNKEYKNLNHER